MTARLRVQVAVAALAAACAGLLLGVGLAHGAAVLPLVGAIVAAVVAGGMGRAAGLEARRAEKAAEERGQASQHAELAEPLRQAAEALARLAAGEDPAPRGRWPAALEGIAGGIAAVAAADRRLAAAVADLARAAAEGDLELRPEPDVHRGLRRHLLADAVAARDAVAAPLLAATASLARLARGELVPAPPGTAPGAPGRLQAALAGCSGALARLDEDARALAAAAAAGRLDQRADPERHEGVFRRVAEGANSMLDSILLPVLDAGQTVERLARGDIPPDVEEPLQGDFEELRLNLNRCSSAVRTVLGDVQMLGSAAVEGRLDARADPARHEGDFRRIVEAMNHALEVMTSPVEGVSAVMQRLAGHDLSARLEGEYPGRYATLAAAINATGDELQGALLRVSETADGVSRAAQAIAASSRSVAAGAGEQAGAMAEMTGALGSVAEMAASSSGTADRARTVAARAEQAAREGAGRMDELERAMERIQGSAQRSVQIIAAVNDVAFQTNLLALNAAIEAARAGDAGRGFAVVAEEVRSLAARSRQAARETAELLSASLRDAEAGAANSRQVAAQLRAAVEEMGQLSGAVSDIAGASRGQAAALQDVNASAAQVSEVTERNRSASVDSSAAARTLSAEAEALASMVRSFGMGGASTVPSDRGS